MRLYFIGGASGSGKTAVMPYLKELLGGRLSVLKSYEEVANIKILDTTNLNLHEVVQGVAGWIRSFDIAPFHVIKVQPHEVDAIENKITSYNNSQAPFIQEQPFVNLNFCIKDDNGVIIAGITSVMYCTLLKKIH
jgi:hypothetical protein